MANDITVLDGNGNAVVLKATDNGSNKTPSQNIDTFPTSWDGTKVTAIAALATGGVGLIGWLSQIWDVMKNGTQAVSVASLPLPTGAATSAAQTSAQTSLTAIAASLAGTLAISATALPLPAGASTSTLQTTLITNTGTGSDSLDGSNNGTVTAHLRKIWSTLVAGFTIGAGENHIGGVSGGMAVSSQTITRPADTTAYAAGDMVGTATSVSQSNMLTITAARATDKLCSIRRVRLAKSTGVLTNAQFRVHFFKLAPTLAVGDNAGFSSGSSGTAAGTIQISTNAGAYLGFCDVTMDVSGAGGSGAIGIGTPAIGSDIMFAPSTGTTSLFAVLEAKAAYAPGNAEVFTLTIESWQD